MAEASFVYPAIVFVTVLFIAVSVCMFMSASNAAELEIEARRAAGAEAGTVVYADAAESPAHGGDGRELPKNRVYRGSAVREANGMFERMAAGGGSEYKNTSMFDIFAVNRYKLYHSVINEVSVIWERQAKDAMENE